MTGTGQSIAPEAEVRVSEEEEPLQETLDYFANPQTLTSTGKQGKLERSVTKLFSPSSEDLRRGSVEITNKAHQVAEELGELAADLGFEFSPANLTDRITELSSKLYSKKTTSDEITTTKKELESLYLILAAMKEALTEYGTKVGKKAAPAGAPFLAETSASMQGLLNILDDYAVNPSDDVLALLQEKGGELGERLTTINLLDKLKKSYALLDPSLKESGEFAGFAEKIRELERAFQKDEIETEKLVDVLMEFAVKLSAVFAGTIAGEKGDEVLDLVSDLCSKKSLHNLKNIKAALLDGEGAALDLEMMAAESGTLVDYLIPALAVASMFNSDALSKMGAVEDPLARASLGLAQIEEFYQNEDVPDYAKLCPEAVLKLFARARILDQATLRAAGLSGVTAEIKSAGKKIRGKEMTLEEASEEMLTGISLLAHKKSQEMRERAYKDIETSVMKSVNLDKGKDETRRKYLETKKNEAISIKRMNSDYGMDPTPPYTEADEKEWNREFEEMWRKHRSEQESEWRLATRMAVFDVRKGLGDEINSLGNVTSFGELLQVQENIGSNSLEALFEAVVCAKTFLSGQRMARGLKGIRGMDQAAMNAARSFGTESNRPFLDVAHLDKDSSIDDIIIARQMFERQIASVNDQIDITTVYGGVAKFYLVVGAVAIAISTGGTTAGIATDLGLVAEGGIGAFFIDATAFGLANVGLNHVVFDQFPETVGAFAGEMLHTYATFGALRGFGKVMEVTRGGAELGMKIIGDAEKMAGELTAKELAKELRSVAAAFGGYTKVSDGLLTDALHIAGAHTTLQASSAVLGSFGLGEMPQGLGSWEDLLTLAILHGHGKMRGGGEKIFGRTEKIRHESAAAFFEAKQAAEAAGRQIKPVKQGFKVFEPYVDLKGRKGRRVVAVHELSAPKSEGTARTTEEPPEIGFEKYAGRNETAGKWQTPDVMIQEKTTPGTPGELERAARGEERLVDGAIAIPNYHGEKLIEIHLPEGVRYEHPTPNTTGGKLRITFVVPEGVPKGEILGPKKDPSRKGLPTATEEAVIMVKTPAELAEKGYFDRVTVRFSDGSEVVYRRTGKRAGEIDGPTETKSLPEYPQRAAAGSLTLYSGIDPVPILKKGLGALKKGAEVVFGGANESGGRKEIGEANFGRAEPVVTTAEKEVPIQAPEGSTVVAGFGSGDGASVGLVRVHNSSQFKVIVMRGGEKTGEFTFFRRGDLVSAPERDGAKRRNLDVKSREDADIFFREQGINPDQMAKRLFSECLRESEKLEAFDAFNRLFGPERLYAEAVKAFPTVKARDAFIKGFANYADPGWLAKHGKNSPAIPKYRGLIGEAVDLFKRMDHPVASKASAVAGKVSSGLEAAAAMVVGAPVAVRYAAEAAVVKRTANYREVEPGVYVLTPGTEAHSVQLRTNYDPDYAEGWKVATRIVVEYGGRMHELDRETYNRKVDEMTENLKARYKAKKEYDSIIEYQGIPPVECCLWNGRLVVMDGNHRLPAAMSEGYPLLLRVSGEFIGPSSGIPNKDSTEPYPIGRGAAPAENYEGLLRQQRDSTTIARDSATRPLYDDMRAKYRLGDEGRYTEAIDGLKDIRERLGRLDENDAVRLFGQELDGRIKFLEERSGRSAPKLDMAEWTRKPNEEEIDAYNKDRQVVYEEERITAFAEAVSYIIGNEAEMARAPADERLGIKQRLDKANAQVPDLFMGVKDRGAAGEMVDFLNEACTLAARDGSTPFEISKKIDVNLAGSKRQQVWSAGFDGQTFTFRAAEEGGKTLFERQKTFSANEVPAPAVLESPDEFGPSRTGEIPDEDLHNARIYRAGELWPNIIVAEEGGAVIHDGVERRGLLGNEVGMRLSIGEPVVIGRDSSSDIVAGDRRVSKRHAVIVKRGEAYFIKDLGSKNGTYVNGGRIGGEEVRLNPGDVIKTGDVTMEFYPEKTLPRGKSKRSAAEEREAAKDEARTPAPSLRPQQVKEPTPPPVHSLAKDRKGLVINGENYDVMHGVTRLEQGDVLPGHRFVLGKPETYNREMLVINFGSDSASRSVLERARDIGRRGKRAGLSNVEIAEEVAAMMNEGYSPLRRDKAQNGEALTVGLFYENGGVCRHRSALLQMALQEAGVPSQYVRGTIGGGGMHAWVMVDGHFVIDPMQGTAGEVQGKTQLSGSIMPGSIAYRAGDRLYLENPKESNIVWRPKDKVKL